jgi:hypothetical protein
MGIGIMFFGVAEPVMHYASPPSAAVGSPNSGIPVYGSDIFLSRGSRRLGAGSIQAATK